MSGKAQLDVLRSRVDAALRELALLGEYVDKVMYHGADHNDIKNFLVRIRSTLMGGLRGEEGRDE